MGKIAGLSPDELKRTRAGEATGNAKRDALVHFVRTLVSTQGTVAATAVEAVRAAGYTDAQLIEIALDYRRDCLHEPGEPDERHHGRLPRRRLTPEPFPAFPSLTIWRAYERPRRTPERRNALKVAAVVGTAVLAPFAASPANAATPSSIATPEDRTGSTRAHRPAFHRPAEGSADRKRRRLAASSAKPFEANHTVENMERLFKAAKAQGYEVFISPHYYYPTDRGWHFHEPLGQVMYDTHMFERRGPLNVDGFAGSGADWVPSLRPYIEDGKTVVVSPHKAYGPETNDLVLQLRKRDITRVILGRMLANMCVEAHARELLEQGFELVIAKDATAAPRHPEWGDGNVAAAINFRFLSKDVLSTDEILKRMV